MAELREAVEAADAFFAAWFPDVADPDAVQPFWFGAKFPRERKRFRSLCGRFGPPLAAAREALRAAGAAAAEALGCRESLRLAVFLDQHARNVLAAAPEGEAHARAREDVAVGDALALSLARGALRRAAGAAEGGAAQGAAQGAAGAGAARVLEAAQATAAQLCFFTLVLRHTKTMQEVSLADRLLAELDALRPGLAVVGAFRLRNRTALQRLRDEACVREALSADEPEQLVRAARPGAAGAAGIPCRRASGTARPRVAREGEDHAGVAACLAPECQAPAGSGAAGELGAEGRLAAWACDATRWADVAEDPLCKELAAALLGRGLLGPGARILLSYSGGVDSTAHLLLLVALLRGLAAGAADGGGGEVAPRDAPNLSCLLLSYPNRDVVEVELERRWASWICEHFGVDLFSYQVNLTRPHGDPPTTLEEVTSALTREEYERFTKEIRFRMYAKLLGESAGGGSAAVVLGHHQDDVDENRLDHLQKGHALGDVEGFRAWREVLGVPLLRPLLGRRKADFLDLLRRFPVPFLRDSTPAWSVRGTTRALLDGFDGDARAALLRSLGRFGALSAAAGSALDEAVENWAGMGITPVDLPRNARGLALDVGGLLNFGVGCQLSELAQEVARIRALWNPAVAAASAAAAARGSPCAVGEIPECAVTDAEWLLFERGFARAAEGVLSSRRQGHYHTSESGPVNRKAMRHLYSNIQACNKPHFSGGLTQELGYLYIAGPPRVVVLYDTSAHPGVSFKEMRDAIMRAAARTQTAAV